MEADVDAQLLFAARRREPGALWALVPSLDEQLVGDDVALDGAVVACSAVQGKGSAGLMRRISIGFPCSASASRSPGFRSPSGWEVTPDGRPEAPPQRGRRPAA